MKDDKTLPRLKHVLPWRKGIWVFGCLKSTLSSAFMSIGIAVIITGLNKNPITIHGQQLPITTGILFILAAMLVIVIIDRWKEKQKEEELDIIDGQIYAMSHLIAEELVQKELNKIKDEVEDNEQ